MLCQRVVPQFKKANTPLGGSNSEARTSRATSFVTKSKLQAEPSDTIATLGAYLVQRVGEKVIESKYGTDTLSRE